MRWIETTIQDVRFAVRGWAKTPGFAFAAVATLALGIGANTAVFSVISGVLLRPIPYTDPDRLVEVTERQPASATNVGTYGPVVPADFTEFRAHSRFCEGFVTYQVSSRNLLGMGEPEQLSIVPAERGLFDLLGTPPFAGRTFAANDPPAVAVASLAFARSHFGAASAALGRALNLDGQSYTIVGVMPADFRFPYRASTVDLWIPWDLPAVMRGRLEAVLARLRPGVAIEAARQELNGMSAPASGGRQVALRPYKDVVVAATRGSLLILFGAVGMVLLVACVNVANLLLARAAARDSEIAIRAALGAGRLRLVRQFLTESLLLSAAGAIAGLALGLWGSRALTRAAGGQLPRAAEIGFDWRVFGFLLAVCVLAGVAFGLAPALAATRLGSSSLKRRAVSGPVRDALVVAEVALAFILLVGAGLLLRSFLHLRGADPGVRPDNVLTVHVALSTGADAAAIEERVSRIPGVRAAGFVSMLPLQNWGWDAGFHVPGRTEILRTELRYVTPGYFRAMGVPLRAGRDFAPSDTAKQPLVVIVNETLARRYLADRDPVGVKLDRGLIVGVVGDVRQARLDEPLTPIVYYTMAQNFAQIRANGSTLAVRGSVPVEGLISAIRAAVREVHPDQALFRIETMQRVIDDSLANHRLYTWLLGLFAAIGALLAMAGIYGVIAYLVALRTREFGIRMALGAEPARVLGLVMRRGAVVVGLGLVLGIGGAAVLTRVLRTLLYGVNATDPPTFASTALLLAIAALLACLIPATRAARVDPAVALRVE